MSDEQVKIESYEKYIAVASYITPAGWLVAFLFKLLSDVKSRYCIFHLKQGLGQSVIYGILLIAISYLDWYIVGELVKVTYLVTQIIGVLSALNGKCRSVPLFGQLYIKCISFIK